MRVPKGFILTAIAALAMLVFTVTPALSRQSDGTGQMLRSITPAASLDQSLNPIVGPAQPPLLIAAKGCEGARAARSYLRSAESALTEVRRESRNLSSALSDVRSALREVEIHREAKRC